MTRKTQMAIFGLFLIGVMCLIVIFCCVGRSEKDEGEDVVDVFDIKIGEAEITLPCTLSDLHKAGVTVYGEVKLQNILDSADKEYKMVEAVVNNGSTVLYLELKTGANVEDGEKNVTVNKIYNYYLTKSTIQLRGDLGLGSKVEKVIEVYGDDYELTAENEDNLERGVVSLEYDDLVVKFDSGMLNYMKIK